MSDIRDDEHCSIQKWVCFVLKVKQKLQNQWKIMKACKCVVVQFILLTFSFYKRLLHMMSCSVERSAETEVNQDCYHSQILISTKKKAKTSGRNYENLLTKEKEKQLGSESKTTGAREVRKAETTYALLCGSVQVEDGGYCASQILFFFFLITLIRNYVFLKRICHF